MRFVATNTQILSGSRHDSAIRISNNKVGLRWSESKQHIRNFRRESRKLMSQNQPEIQYAAFLAIDWADQKHVWSLQDANSGTCERGEVDHMPEAVEAGVAQMSQRFAGRPMAVAVEQKPRSLGVPAEQVRAAAHLPGAAGHDRQLAESVLFLGSQ